MVQRHFFQPIVSVLYVLSLTGAAVFFFLYFLFSFVSLLRSGLAFTDHVMLSNHSFELVTFYFAYDTSHFTKNSLKMNYLSSQ